LGEGLGVRAKTTVLNVDLVYIDVIKQSTEIVLAHTYIILRYATVSIRWIWEVEAGYLKATCLLLAVLKISARASIKEPGECS